jgi:hypothetical protein
MWDHYLREHGVEAYLEARYSLKTLPENNEKSDQRAA